MSQGQAASSAMQQQQMQQVRLAGLSEQLLQDDTVGIQLFDMLERTVCSAQFVAGETCCSVQPPPFQQYLFAFLISSYALHLSFGGCSQDHAEMVNQQSTHKSSSGAGCSSRCGTAANSSMAACFFAVGTAFCAGT